MTKKDNQLVNKDDSKKNFHIPVKRELYSLQLRNSSTRILLIFAKPSHINSNYKLVYCLC